jgi:copper chaperone CopZ
MSPLPNGWVLPALIVFSPLVLSALVPPEPALGQPGQGASPAPATTEAAGARIQVKGLFCPFCEGSIEKKLLRLPGLAEVGANWSSGEVLVRFEPGRPVSRKELEDAVKDAGFTSEKIVFEPRNPLESLVESSPGPPRTLSAPAPGILEERVFSPGTLQRPQALALAPDGTLWIADTENRRIVHAGSDGALIGTLSPKGLARPSGIDVAQDGTLAVTDFLGDRVWLLKPDGKVLSRIGGPGQGPGQLDAPVDVLFLPDGTLLVAEFQGNRLQRFDRQGRSLSVVTGEGTGPGRFTYPTKLQLLSEGRVGVSDSYAHRVVTLDDSYQPSAALGKSGRHPGDLQIPGGVASVGDDLWIADFDNHRVDVLKADGTLVKVLMRTEKGGLGFDRPVDIATSPGGRTVYVLDWAHSEVHRLNLEAAS